MSNSLVLEYSLRQSRAADQRRLNTVAKRRCGVSATLLRISAGMSVAIPVSMSVAESDLRMECPALRSPGHDGCILITRESHAPSHFPKVSPTSDLLTSSGEIH